MRAIGFALLALVFAVEPVVAQSTPPATGVRHVTLDSSSRLTIRGRTNVGRWSCASRTLETAVQIDSAGPRPASADATAHDPVVVHATLRVPVASLGCGNRRMERDLRRALRASTYPVIQFRITSYAMTPVARGYDGSVEGDLTLNGTTRPIDVRTAVVVDGDRAHATGGADLRMSAFGVRPPTALLGMIRARDALTVRFDLRATLQ